MIEIKTFTGPTILWEEESHGYFNLQNERLLSATAYAESKLPAFDADRIAGFTAKKYNADKAEILDMWDRNGQVSRAFGTALHLAMEQWFRFPYEKGTPRGYNLPKSPYLRDAVVTFPLRDELILPERVVADLRRKRAGRTDGLWIHDDETLSIVDFKSDAKVEKNLDHHEIQLNFYREVIEASGLWRVRNMVVWGFDGAWTQHYIRRIKLED